MKRLAPFVAAVLACAVPAVGAKSALDRAEVVRAVEEALAPRADEGSVVRVTSVGLPNSLPEGEKTLSVQEPRGSLPRASTVGVDVLVDGKRVGRAWARVEVARERPVVVLARSVRKGTVLGLEDVELRPAKSAAGSLDDPAFAAGKRLVRNLAVGAALTAGDLEEPPAVEKGELVRLVVRVGGVTATTVGKALHAARVGESVPVENVGSGRTVQGVLREAGVVEVPSE